MNTILFLLTSGRMRAFIKQQSVQLLKYKGANDMLYKGSGGLTDFVDYMVHEYAEPDKVRLFFCCDTPQALRATIILLEDGCYPHYSLTSLSYCLSSFLKEQNIDNCWVHFENTTWRISNGLAIEENNSSGKCPQEISHRQLAEMFFYEKKNKDKQDQSGHQSSLKNQLADYVESSKVKPRHHL